MQKTVKHPEIGGLELVLDTDKPRTVLPTAQAEQLKSGPYFVTCPTTQEGADWCILIYYLDGETYPVKLCLPPGRTYGEILCNGTTSRTVSAWLTGADVMAAFRSLPWTTITHEDAPLPKDLSKCLDVLARTGLSSGGCALTGDPPDAVAPEQVVTNALSFVDSVASPLAGLALRLMKVSNDLGKKHGSDRGEAYLADKQAAYKQLLDAADICEVADCVMSLGLLTLVLKADPRIETSMWYDEQDRSFGTTANDGKTCEHGKSLADALLRTAGTTAVTAIQSWNSTPPVDPQTN